MQLLRLSRSGRRKGNWPHTPAVFFSAIAARTMPVLFILIAHAGFCQPDSAQKRGNLGIELTVSMLPPATIIHHQGTYRLKSNLQSAYDLGINYHYNINRKFAISTGFHMVVGKRNLFTRLNSYDAPIIEDKELWGSIRIPLIAERKFRTKKNAIISAKAGLNFRYSGLMLDESIGSMIMNSNNQWEQIFNAEFPAYKKPWITYLMGAYRQIVLRNYNVLSIGLQLDYSPTWFVKGDFAISFPNQPVTYGAYKVSGTGLGLSAQYIFTGANKTLLRNKGRLTRGRRNKEKSKKENILRDFVFKGNHIQFTFVPFTTFKAKLQQTAGNHPVSAANALGLLLSFKYQVNFNNNYSLITGPEAIFAGRNITSFFDKDDFNPPLRYDQSIGRWNSYVQDLIIGLPVIIEKRKLYARKKYLFGSAGMRFNASTGADFDGFSAYVMRADSSLHNALGWDVYANNDAKPWVSFPLAIGHGWLLKNNNLLSLSLAANVSFTKYVNGTYYADIPGRPVTTGRYSTTGSFLGLALQYNFTNANYRIRKSYEK